MPIHAGTIARRAVLLVCVCGACTPMTLARTGPPPRAEQPIAVWLMTPEGQAGHAFYARNDTDHIHRVTGVTLSDCVNLREACGAHPVDVVLCPGEALRIFATRPREPGDRIFFNWDYQTRAYEPDEPVVGADCGEPGGRA